MKKTKKKNKQHKAGALKQRKHEDEAAAGLCRKEADSAKQTTENEEAQTKNKKSKRTPTHMKSGYNMSR